jgi:DNA-directed RNA polymerase subunit RPC12/RpoP
MEHLTRQSHQLLLEVEEIEEAVESFKQNVKQFYLEALTSRYQCPGCGERFRLTGPSQANCSCGASFDPTVQFQKSTCCSVGLTKRVLHYVCSKCGKTVRSLFLFDEKLFDQEYYRGRMKWSRERKRQHDAVVREMLRVARSHALVLLDEIDLNALPDLTEDIDHLVGCPEAALERWSPETGPPYEQYRRHIIGLLAATTRFSTIAPLIPEERRDRVHRFATLIFMEHNREVDLCQMDNDILVSRA